MDAELYRKQIRFTNYIAASQLYLKDNFFLEKPLSRDHIKRRLLGHWGTVPGLNAIYSHLNTITCEIDNDMMLILGPGHGYPALLANLYLEGTLGEFYPEYIHGKYGMEKLIRNFSWPDGFPSHQNPATPGVILEGGELGYSLSTAFGAVMDNPNLIVACVVGDGESETGPLATAWHSNKFINPKEDGAVLPIIHLNKFKISGPSIYGTMDNYELINLFTGYGYEPIIIETNANWETSIHEYRYAYSRIRTIQSEARQNDKIYKPKWPMIIFKNKKGLSGPLTNKGEMIEDSFRSHSIPLKHVDTDDDEFQLLKVWLESYKINELLTPEYKPIPEILKNIPKGNRRMGMTRYVNDPKSKELALPQADKYEVSTKAEASSMTNLGKYLGNIITHNDDDFRVFSPDETESNKLHILFDHTTRRYIWPIPLGSSKISKTGRVMEMLSEHTLQGWLHGYLFTGRHGVFVSYEAFLMIVASMTDQYSKFLKKAKDVNWRKPIPSLNYILTSTAWRQDHNGFSHQNPGFISTALNDYTSSVNIDFPPDANTLILTMEKALKSKNQINIIVAGKRPKQQYLTMKQAKKQISDGVMIWDHIADDKNPDIVFAATGDYVTQEAICAIKMLWKLIPEIKTRFVSISELSCFGIGENINACTINQEQFNKIFTKDKPIIYAYHGYPEDINGLIFKHPAADRFKIHGYIEKGTTTTPFDMLVKNNISRIQLAMEAINYAQIKDSNIQIQSNNALNYLTSLLEKHKKTIDKSGDDLDEIRNFDKYFQL